jgi:hypothetical protein
MDEEATKDNSIINIKKEAIGRSFSFLYSEVAILTKII